MGPPCRRVQVVRRARSIAQPQHLFLSALPCLFLPRNVPTRPVACATPPNATAATAAHIERALLRTPASRWHAAGHETQGRARLEKRCPLRAERAPRAPDHGQPGLEGVLQRQGMARPLVRRKPADRAGYRQGDESRRRWSAQDCHRGLSRCVPASVSAVPNSFDQSLDCQVLGWLHARYLNFRRVW